MNEIVMEALERRSHVLGQTASPRQAPIDSRFSEEDLLEIRRSANELFQEICLWTIDSPQPVGLRNGVKAIESKAHPLQLRGIVYVVSLLFGALDKLGSAGSLNAYDQDNLLRWADLLSDFAHGRVAPEHAPELLQRLESLSWFAKVPETFTELIQARLAADAARLQAAVIPSEPELAASVVTVGSTMLSNELIQEVPETRLNVPPAADGQIEEVSRLETPEISEQFDEELGLFDSSDSDIFASDTTSESVPQTERAAKDEFVLLAEAFVQTAEEVGGAALQYESLESSRAECLEICETLAERFTTAANAAGFMQVPSVAAAIEAWHLQFQLLIDDQTQLSELQFGLFPILPQLWADYFLAPSVDTARAAMELLANPFWPQPLSVSDIEGLVERLSKVELIASRQVAARSEEFDPDDLSLSIPKDADMSVVENLLRELPSLSADFTRFVTKICDGDLSAVESAQRIAHTLKGSANTVGVRGVANLTHQLEDILVIVERDQLQVTPGLGNFLSEAADCLEEMSECVAGIGGEPQDASRIYSESIQWTNRLLNGDRESDDSTETDTSELDIGEPQVKPAQFVDTQSFASNTTPKSLQSQHIVELSKDDANESPGQGENAESAGEHVRVPVALIDRILRIVGESSVLLARVQNEVETINQTQRNVGDTASRLEELSHDLDRMVDTRSGLLVGRNKSGPQGFDELELDEYNEMHTMARRFAEIGSDSRVLDEQLRNNVMALGTVSGEMERLQSELRDLGMQTRMVPINSIGPRLQRAVRQASRLTHKAVQLTINGGETLIDNETLGHLVDPLMHLLRNAVDHGLEVKSDRLAAGKGEIGRIALSFARDGAFLKVNCQDDGAGLDIRRIIEKARSKGLIDPNVQLTEAEANQLILRPGFSTRDSANQLSGRGIGLDVVAQMVREQKGLIEIQSARGQGTSFALSLPLVMSSIPVMVAKAPQFSFALSLRGVEQIASSDALKESGGGLSLEVDDQPVVARFLEDVLNYPRCTVDMSDRVVLVVRNDQRQLAGVIVPNLGQARNVLTRPLGRWVNPISGIDGVAALGDGSAAPICDLTVLLNSEKRGSVQGLEAEVREAIVEQSRPLCLVVDDSVSVRRSMESFVLDLGFDVLGARDGIEALAILERKSPVLVIADFEMPRMNGVELTSNIRGNEKFKTVPVIMITSRSSEKHRKLAMDAGVNSYMTKPYTEDDLAEQIYSLTKSDLPKN